jgi:hypothetical protein
MRVQLFSFYKDYFFVSPIMAKMPSDQDATNWDFALVEREEGTQTVYYAGADYLWREIPEESCGVEFEFIDLGDLSKVIKYKEAPKYMDFKKLSGEAKVF